MKVGTRSTVTTIAITKRHTDDYHTIVMPGSHIIVAIVGLSHDCLVVALQL